MDFHEKKIKLEDADLLALFGSGDEFLHVLENRFSATIIARGDTLTLKGDSYELKAIEQIFKEMQYILTRTGNLTRDDVDTVINLIDVRAAREQQNGSGAIDSVVFHGARGGIKPRTPKQYEYIRKVDKNDLVFAIGPAGTGKTFLAVAMALASLRSNETGRIILSRPAVEAGESLGFLPGDLREKIDPYLRPLTDSLHFMLSADKMKSMLEKEIIEIIPLAYMRGRTLNNSFVILDEAQNATNIQMKMFLTRLGENSKAIVTGDITQIDLPDKNNSGLIQVQSILKEIDGIEFVYFSRNDVVRHRLVAEIIKAYEGNNHDNG
ncbi:MAG: Phosphate starvation-inducible protein PhoH-like protein [Ignavibacteria bacterium]|nr:Phosphate starvation-inducible protein PhoH-like protein [Ignavibacteria bacterium]